MIKETGLDATFQRHRILKEATHAAVSVWAEAGAFDFNVVEPTERSASVTTLKMASEASSEPLRTVCRDRLGVLLGVGLTGDHQFRIAHMGHCNAPMMLGVLGVVEAGMTAINLPHGTGGVAAAADVIGKATTP
jgi:alanine-glyoxylate transaminase/serine-glyoxylate transaminase/serine-pyruvate transaminase